MLVPKSPKKIIKAALTQFAKDLEPLEEGVTLLPLADNRTGAWYCECHVRAHKLIELGTVDVPLDPDEQAEYRANRDIAEDAQAFEIMKDDAKRKRSFSNIVTEYTKDFDAEHPLKIIGGQHRFEAIRLALEDGVDEVHGIKVYLGLDMEQRLDVQLISNTNIATSGDLYDRMHETVIGPELRDWCQSVGLLKVNHDFAGRRERGGRITVQLARTFISNFYLGQRVDLKKFDTTDTTPELCQSGRIDSAWEALRAEKKADLWKDPALRRAAEEFARLISAQRAAFESLKGTPADYPHKATNPAVLASWAYTAGMLQKNKLRLDRHYALASIAGQNPLNAAALAKGKHKTDPDSYRGLGYRTDSKERGRFVELFGLQAESGNGITQARVDAAIAQYHAKRAVLEAQKARAKAASG